MTVDLMAATQAAVFAALEAGVNGAPVHDHVKQDTPPPFVKIGTIEGTNVGSKEDPREEFDVEVHTIYRGADRSVLLAIMNEVRTSLEGIEIAAEGVSFWTPDFVNEAASDAGPDGVTYAGITVFNISAEPA